MDSTSILLFSFFFFNDTATTEIYTLSLHDALPISAARSIAREAREQQMVLPQPVDAQVLPRIALAREAGVFQEPDREIGRAHAELQSQFHLVCRLLLEKKNRNNTKRGTTRQFTSLD